MKGERSMIMASKQAKSVILDATTRCSQVLCGKVDDERREASDGVNKRIGARCFGRRSRTSSVRTVSCQSIGPRIN